jgi:DNA-binding NtrC family response regulator
LKAEKGMGVHSAFVCPEYEGRLLSQPAENETVMTHQKEIYLIVDDEPDMCWALQNLLAQRNLLSQNALNGNQALELICKTEFSAVLVDAKLPDIEGLDLVKKIHAIDPNLKVFMVSGYFYKDDPGIKNALDEKHISGFISKPFQNQEILTVLDLCR